jgi:hypothetical protein
VRAALLLTWNGSLLYPGLGELALLSAGCVGARRALLSGQLASALATVALVAPVVIRAPVPPGGPFSATELSWLHLAAYAGVAGVAGGVLALERLSPARSGWLRLARAAGVALALGLLLLGSRRCARAWRGRWPSWARGHLDLARGREPAALLRAGDVPAPPARGGWASPT